jgi:hypothetical protein
VGAIARIPARTRPASEPLINFINNLSDAISSWSPDGDNRVL